MDRANKALPLVYFAHQDWWSHHPCSSYHLSRSFSRHRLVLFVNSIGMGMPSPRSPDFMIRVTRKIRSYTKFLVKVDENIYVFSPITIPGNKTRTLFWINQALLSLQIYPLLFFLRIRKPIVFVANPFFALFIKRMKKRALAYFVTDKYDADETQNGVRINQLQKQLLENADAVFCVSQAMHSRLIKQGFNAYYMPHGVDFDHFSSIQKDIDSPIELKFIQRPIVGFMGAIESLILDRKLLEKIIEDNRQMSFVFVGNLSNELKYLMQHKNCHMLGKKDYALMPIYLRAFDVCILPFNQNEWIHYCNPIKLKEYLAAGKPTVSTYFPEIDNYQDVVYCARDYNKFSELLRKAVEEDNPVLVQQRMDKVRECRWETVANNMLSTLNKVIS